MTDSGEGAKGRFDLENRANRERIQRLHDKGVRFPCGTGGVFIGGDVNPDRLEKGAVIHPGCRITGKETLIRAGAAVGLTGPCVLENMVLDRDVRLGSGAFRESVLLKGAHLGSSIRVRENCLIEEGCELSFSVDVKHTFLLAHVILGSEINFCDLLMAGGTSRKDHSEVGSGVIHFNFTPYGASGDKATASRMGDAVHGVFYRSPRIFIGGHSSLVGPLKIGYGAVIAAASRVARDVPENTLCFGVRERPQDQSDFDFLCYRSIARKIRNSVEYIAQLAAFWHFYAQARRAAAGDPLETAAVDAASRCIEGGIEARVKRLDTVREYMAESIRRNRKQGEEALAVQQEAFRDGWPAARETLLGFRNAALDEAAREGFMKDLTAAIPRFAGDFTGLITKGLEEEAVRTGIRWLGGIVRELTHGLEALAPPAGPSR